MSRAWSCITLGEERQYGGNIGYDDELTSRYSYDSNVANHKRIAAGDLIVLRDNSHAPGLAQIDRVTHETGTKLIRRCPTCNTTGIKERQTKRPRWRCNNGHEFDTPRESEETVERYVAHFGGFERLQHPIPVRELKGVALRPSDHGGGRSNGLPRWGSSPSTSARGFPERRAHDR